MIPLDLIKLWNCLEYITIYEAKHILEDLAHEYMLNQITIIDSSATYRIRQSTISAEYHITWYHYDFAYDQKLMFTGGPPNYRKSYTGSLLMYVCDCILLHAAQYGVQTVLHILEPYGFTMETNYEFNGKSIEI